MDTTLYLFEPYAKTPRLFREVILSEKLDGTNSSVFIRELPDDEVMPTHIPPVAVVGKHLLYAGSRTRWITPGKTTDNYGFAAWVQANAEELAKLGPGRHYGEWYGRGINRGYGLDERRFALFNVDRWQDGATKVDPRTGEVTPLSARPACCHVVPVLYRGEFDTTRIEAYLNSLRTDGSRAVPGYMNPEGLIVFHTAAQRCFKVLLKNDEGRKGE